MTSWFQLCFLFFAVTLVSADGDSYQRGKSEWVPFDTAHRCKHGIYPCLIFEDNFDRLDLKTWQHEITAGNFEFEYYTNNRSNSYVKNGILHLKPTLSEERYGADWVYNGKLELWGGEPANLCTGNQWWGCERQASGATVVDPIQSARIRTVNSFAFRYGRLEVEAKLPRGDWLWPAIWLLPRKQAYGTWPASGEIDLLESRGNLDLRDPGGNQIGAEQFGSTLHFGPYNPENGWETSHASYNLKNGRTFADDFHLYRFDWDENGFQFYIDNILILNTTTGEGYWKKGYFDRRFPEENNCWRYAGKDAPFDQDFHIIMNVAVGGTTNYFHDSFKNVAYPKPWSDYSPTAMRQFWENRNLWLPTWPNDDDRAMQVNYIRVWKLKKDSFE